MRRELLLLSMCVSFLLASLAFARTVREGRRPIDGQNFSTKTNALSLDRKSEKGPALSSQAGRTLLVEFTFDSVCTDPVYGQYLCPTTQGWTSHDLSEQTGSYFHVDDFADLGGGDFGRLGPIEGSQSAWCGARPPGTGEPGYETLCGYAALPGYGNNWDQSWVFKCIEVPDSERVVISYLITWDSEPYYDFTYVEYATDRTCDALANIGDIPIDDWNTLKQYDFSDTGVLVHDTIPAGHDGVLRIRFHFVSDYIWSDEDGLWETDGAVIIDSVTVEAEASGIYDFEDFEDETPGDLATTDGDWECYLENGYGDFAALFNGAEVIHEAPCPANLTHVWGFFSGSTETYACGGYPFQASVPRMNDRNQYIMNEVWSPKIAWTESGISADVVFDVYRDMPIQNMVFYYWRVRSWVNGFPGMWKDRGLVSYGIEKAWVSVSQEIGDLIDPNATHIQLALRCMDFCAYWCGVFGDGVCHSHSPMFDNVRLYRTGPGGIFWNVSAEGLFQDNFPDDGTATGTAGANTWRNDYSQARDSAYVKVLDPVVGLNTGPAGCDSAVYCYVSVKPQNYPPSALEAPEAGLCPGLNGPRRYPVVDSVNAGGLKWYVIQMNNFGTDHFCVDLNDNLFTAPDTILFFFGAENADHEWAYWSEFTGTTYGETAGREDAASYPMEFQILPTGNSDVLYVDNFDGGGAQPLFDTAFDRLGIAPDRFDSRDPDWGTGALGRQVKDVRHQLIPFYRKILWSCGDRATLTIGEGDFGVLYRFLHDWDVDTLGCGVYISGNNVAESWGNGANATDFKSTYCDFNLLNGSHRNFGLQTHPLVIGRAATSQVPFTHPAPLGPDTLLATAGCSYTYGFDIIAPVAGVSTLEMAHEGDPAKPAVIAQTTTNSAGNPARVVLSGFSFHRVGDECCNGIPNRFHHLQDILEFFENDVDDPIGIGGANPYTNTLSHNYPNPFNPTTTIEYSIKERGHVTLKIYNVAGQLVKTLVNEVKNPRIDGYKVLWNGRNNAGGPVASGVYFYRLVTKDFSKTKKMVVLK